MRVDKECEYEKNEYRRSARRERQSRGSASREGVLVENKCE